MNESWTSDDLIGCADELDDPEANCTDLDGSKYPVPQSSPYYMPWLQQFAWVTVFALMLFVAIVGNALVAWIVLAHRRMKTVTNYFLVNLSMADLMMSLFNCIFNFTFMLNSHWPFGSTYCTFNNFIANVTVAASVFTLMAISCDRYVAIVHPLRPRMSKWVARIVISAIWMASILLAIPTLLYSKTVSTQYPNGELRVICLIKWPDGVAPLSQLDFIYNIIFMLLTYVVPVTAMAVCYSRMGFVLWGSRGIGELSQRQSESIRSKRKVVRMFIVVVLLFTVCWLPYHCYFVAVFIVDQVITFKYVQHVYMAFYWLAMSNAMINPLVYYWMNARFRQYFKTVICRCVCLLSSNRPSASGRDTPPIFARTSGRNSNSQHHHIRTGAAVLLRTESHKPARIMGHQRPVRSEHRSSTSSQKHHSAVEYRCLDKTVLPLVRTYHHSLYVASSPILMEDLCCRVPSPNPADPALFWPAKSLRPCSNNNNGSHHQVAGNKNAVFHDLLSSGQTI